MCNLKLQFLLLKQRPNVFSVSQVDCGSFQCTALLSVKLLIIDHNKLLGVKHTHNLKVK